MSDKEDGRRGVSSGVLILWIGLGMRVGRAEDCDDVFYAMEHSNYCLSSRELQTMKHSSSQTMKHSSPQTGNVWMRLIVDRT